MKIAQVHLGLLPIPPNGWGAVEKIIWNYKLALENLGHQVEIPYINDIKLGMYDIVHVHAWNHALELRDKKIPYIFTCHDHHTFLYGKNSILYYNNLEAMRYAELAIVPAEYLIEYFENIPIYLEHGVDTHYYSKKDKSEEIQLLCVGNNGLIEDKTFDRKGFRFAIEAAKELNLPITVVGPTNNNKHFFEVNNDLYFDKLNILYDLNDNDLLDVFNTHHILVHATNVEAGHPPLTLLEAASCGLPIITTDCCGDLYITEIQRNANDVQEKIKKVLSSYDSEVEKTLNSVKNFDWSIIAKKLSHEYSNIINIGKIKMSNNKNMKDSALYIYDTAKHMKFKNTFEVNFIDGPFLQILGPNDKEYSVEFVDLDSNNVVYSAKLKNNTWGKCSKKYSFNCKIVARSEDGEYFEHTYNPTGKRVLISFESSSLGDTLAWFPCVEEFRKKWNCNIIVSTFLNDLFKEKYPHFEFVTPGSTVHNLYAKHSFGIFYKENEYNTECHPTNPIETSLQEIALDILGLERIETKPLIKNIKPYTENKKPYVTIAIHSTAQAKYWNNPTGWQETVDYVKSLGYDVYLLSKEEDGYMGNKNPEGVIHIKDKSLEEIGGYILGSKLFIGISSGLSWYSWALNVPTILISGFTDEKLEMKNDVYRVINKNVCNGCWSKYTFDKGNWNWCPVNEKTEKQFECTKTIKFGDVKEKIDAILI